MSLSLVAALLACTHDADPPAPSLAAFDPSLSLAVESKVGKALSKEVAVSGRDRLEVPDTVHWACGNPLRGSSLSNVAWLELANPSSDTISVSLELDGLTETHPRLFVYASKNAPLRDCLTFSGQRQLAGTSSVVVEPTSYAAVLLATGAATGVYTVVIKTEHVIAQ
jgi:hypothetical protein